MQLPAVNDDTPRKPLCITYISASRIPSLEANSIHVMKMCQAMVQEGLDVALYNPDYSDLPSLDNRLLEQHYGVRSQFPIYHVNSSFLNSSFLGWWSYAIQSVGLARKRGSKLIYTRNVLVALVAAYSEIPTWYEAHDIVKGRLAPIYFRLLIKTNAFYRLVVITDALRRWYQERFSSLRLREQIIVAPDAVDLERFADLPTSQEAKKKIGLPANAFTIGYAGHLYPGRGIELIMELAEELPDFQFLIAGGTQDDVVYWQEFCTSRRLNNVRMFGFIPNAELPLYLAASEILLMPHQEVVAVSGGKGNIAQWCSPMKMFEYLATGRLIISSNLPVLQEVLRDGENAVLCSPGDIDKWLDAILYAHQNLAWRLKISRQAKADAEHYTWRGRVQKLFRGLDW